MSRRRFLVAGAAALALVAGLAEPAAAATVSPAEAPQGGTITVTGTFAAVCAQIDVLLDAAPPPIGTQKGPVQGAYSVTATLPPDVTPGTHRVLVVCTPVPGTPDVNNDAGSFRVVPRPRPTTTTTTVPTTQPTRPTTSRPDTTTRPTPPSTSVTTEETTPSTSGTTTDTAPTTSGTTREPPSTITETTDEGAPTTRSTTTEPGETTGPTTGTSTGSSSSSSSTSSSSSSSSTRSSSSTSSSPGTTRPTSTIEGEGGPTPAPLPPAALPDEVLLLDRAAVIPGGDVLATGRGCDPGAAVDLTVAPDPGGDGSRPRPVGRATADAAGNFDSDLDTDDLPIGRHRLEASCGTLLATDLDVVLAANVTGPGQSLTFVWVIILVGIAVSQAHPWKRARRTSVR
jgi:hypothetical protein